MPGKIAKWLLIIAGAIVLFLVAAAVILAVVVDPNAYKQRIAALVQQQTGRELNIPGDLQLSLFPWLGLQTGKVVLGNAPGFGTAPFASLDEADIKVRLAPLFRGQVEVGTVVLHGLDLHLTRNKNGRANWDDLIAGGGAAPPATGGGQGGGKALGALAIGGVDLRGGHIDWDDRQTNQHLVLSNLTVESGALRLGAPFEVAVRTRFQSQAPALQGQLGLDSGLVLDPAAKVYSVRNLVFSAQASGAGLPGTGELEAKLSVPAGTADLGKGTLEIAKLDLDAAGVTLSGQLHGRELLTSPSVQGSLASEEFAPRKLFARLGAQPPATADAAALSKASLQTRFSAAPTRLALENLVLRLDESTLKGTAAVRDFSKPVVRFDLAVDRLDADRYLPPPAAAPGAGSTAPAPTAPSAAATPGSAAAAGAAQLPLEMLRSLDVQGTLTVAELSAAGLHSKDAHMELQGRGGRLRLHPLGAQLYGGVYRGDVRADFTKARPQLAMDEALDKVQIGPLLADLQGKPLLEGTANLSAKLTAQGIDAPTLTRSLNGEARFSIDHGALHGINIAQLIREGMAKVKGQSAPKAQAPRKTDFTALSGSAQVRNGVAHNRDLSAKSPLLRVDGRGTVDLVKENIDYVADVAVVKSLEGQGGAGMEQLKGLTIPLQIKGPLSGPNIQLDVDRVLKTKAKQELHKKEGELKQRLNQEKGKRSQELERKLQDKLKNLLQ